MVSGFQISKINVEGRVRAFGLEDLGFWRGLKGLQGLFLRFRLSPKP